MDTIDIAFVPLNMQNLHTIVTNNLEFTRKDCDNLLLTIQVQLDLHVSSRNRGHDNLSNTSKNLSFLEFSLELPCHDSNRDLFSAISEEKVEAVVHLVVVCLAIKGGDVGRCNTASSRNSGKSVKSNKHEGSSQRDGKNTFEEGRFHTNVDELVSASIVLNGHLNFIPKSVDLGNHSHVSGGDMIERSLNQMTNKQSFGNVNNVWNNHINNWQFAQESGNNQFS